MKIESRLEFALRQGRELLSQANRQLEFPQAQLFSQRLERVFRKAESSATGAPVCIVLMGGTGAGKSELFNALIREPGASPVSHAERLFTRQLHIAADSVDASMTSLPLEGAVYHKGISGLVLVDTPDIDGALPQNRLQAQQALEVAEIIIYVALPEKRSNFVIQEELKKWASRKHWFFVLNKIDLCRPDELGAIRRDFAGRISELGFSSSDSTLFLVSAKEPEHTYSELERLRAAVFSSRTRDEIAALHQSRIVRALAYAANEEVTAPLAQLVGELESAEENLLAQGKEIYARVFSSPAMRQRLEEVVRARVWRAVPGRVGGFLAIPLWIMARFHQVWLTFSLSRLVTGGLSFARLLQAVWLGAVNYVRGILPLQNLLAGFRQTEIQELKNLRRDAIRKLEDLGLFWEEETAAVQETPLDRAEKRSPENWTDWLDRNLSLQTVGREDPHQAQLLQSIMQAVEVSSAAGVGRAVNRFHSFLGNLLPFIAFIDISRKCLVHWLDNKWLPGEFYLMSIFLLALSTVPGCFLIGAAVKARVKIGAPEEPIAGLAEPLETEPLRATRMRAELLLKKIRHFRRQMETQAQTLASDLQTSRFGSRQRQAPDRGL